MDFSEAAEAVQVPFEPSEFEVQRIASLPIVEEAWEVGLFIYRIRWGRKLGRRSQFSQWWLNRCHSHWAAVSSTEVVLQPQFQQLHELLSMMSRI